VILEIEPKVPSDITILEAINRVASVGAKLQACEDRNASKEELLGVVVQDIHDFLHFPLNMILKFHPDWHGEVVSEIADIPDYSYFGMHFPATDIPAQVRETYKKYVRRSISLVDQTEQFFLRKMHTAIYSGCLGPQGSSCP
jgi:light-regulated signal transduction histidine kinase (bacteriophytochrome)